MVTSSYSDMSIWLYASIREILARKDVVTIGLPGGHSLDGWYTSMLVDREAWKGIGATRLRWCLVDERCVGADSWDRNDVYVWEIFLKPLGCMPEQFLCLWMPEVNALDYSEIISTPDIAIFWLWSDGHIASLFPGDPVLSVQTEGYIYIHDAPKIPSERISLTPLSIQKIPHTALFVVWEEKKQAFQNFLNPHMTITECPAKLLNPDIIFQQ